MHKGFEACEVMLRHFTRTSHRPHTAPNSIAPVFRITFKEDDRTAYELLSETELKFRMLSKYKKTEGDRRR